jgi:hypothetical protein
MFERAITSPKRSCDLSPEAGVNPRRRSLRVDNGDKKPSDRY